MEYCRCISAVSGVFRAYPGALVLGDILSLLFPSAVAIMEDIMDFCAHEIELYKDRSDVGFCIYDAEGHYTYMNDAFLRIRNVSREEYLGLTPYDLYRNNLIDRCVIDTVYRTKTTTSDVQTVMSKNGRVLRKHLVTICPVLNEAGGISCFVAYYRDLDSFNAEYDSSSVPSHMVEQDGRIRDWIIGQNSTCPFVAKSSNMVKLYSDAKRVANIDSTVLLTGETGTGKEVFASYIHNISSRKNHDFVVVDCASIPESLMESELFGYEKGTFTGALTQGKRGLIESADGGTLFLDEVNSLPLSLQGKLLRVIETKTIKKLGSVSKQRVDFRLIAATNTDLAACVEKKTFRADLYYRLNVLPFRLPPLRERKEDIIPLAQRFLSEFQEKYGIERDFSANLYEEMLRYHWPGNVRELRNFVERTVIMGPANLEIAEESAHHSGAEAQTPVQTFSLSGIPAGEQECQVITEALKANRGHRENTAKALGIARRTLQYKLKKYNIS